jgi:IS4 transposase
VGVGEYRQRLSRHKQPAAQLAAPRVSALLLSIIRRCQAGLPEGYGDPAFDSDPLDEQLRTQGIEMIAPHRSNRTKPKTQDGRKLRRYKRRWKVERLWAWLQNFRRVLVRHDHYAHNYLGFVYLGCLVILLRTFFG